MLKTTERNGNLIGGPSVRKEVAGEESNWPEFLPVKRIKPGPFEFALGALLFANLVALGCLVFFYFAS